MRPRKQHETLAFQHNAGLGEEVASEFKVGDRVLTVEGVPGRVTAVLSGPFQKTEHYEVILDNGLGGGEYRLGDLQAVSGRSAKLHEAVEVYASIPVEATTSHTADLDYPELGTILYDRLPNENVKIAANTNKAEAPELSMDDSTQKIDQNEDEIEEEEDNDNTDVAATEEPESDEGGPRTPEEAAEANRPEIDPPSACSFCGHNQFEEPTLTGRGARAQCSQCGGTMKSWGGQWEPEFPNSPQNQAAGTWDYRSGGPGGVVQAPGANFKTSSKKTSLQYEAGIMSWIIDKIYDHIQQRNENAFLGTRWAEPAMHQLFQGPEHTDHTCTYCAPNQVTHTASNSDFDCTWKWHFTATWKDVQAKAKRLRAEGKVRIIAAGAGHVSGEVQGDHNLYETQLDYVPGSKKVAFWSCGCKWGAYSWGRSPAFRKFEGRLCSHGLALQYEAGSRGMFGREIGLDSHLPDRDISVQYDRANKEHLTRTSALDEDIYQHPELVDLHHAPIFASVMQMTAAGENIENIAEFLADFHVSKQATKEMIYEAMFVQASSVDDWLLRSTGVPHNPYNDKSDDSDGGEGDSGGVSATASFIHEADYSSNSPLPGLDAQQNYISPTPHSNTQNPGSTGWASGQDPLDWGRSLISNNFGLSSEAGLNGPDYQGLTFTHEVHPDEDLAPDFTERHTITAHHPEHGYVGHMHYWFHPDEKQVLVGKRETAEDHRRRGVATAIDNHFRELHPGHSVDPGVRTEDGANWADSRYGPSATDRMGDDFNIGHPFTNPKAAGLFGDNRYHTLGRQHGAEYAQGLEEPADRGRLTTEVMDRVGDLAHTDPKAVGSYLDGFHRGHDEHFGTSDRSRMPWFKSPQGTDVYVKSAAQETSVSGLALKAADTGRVLMLQRSHKDDKDPAAGTWEFPGGHHEPGDATSLHAAVREWEEEVGHPLPQGGSVASTWTSGPYRGHVVTVPSEDMVDLSQRVIANPDGDHHEQAAWWDVDHAKKNPALRPECKSTPWEDIKKAAILHDTPEPALPEAYGELEDDPTDIEAQQSQVADQPTSEWPGLSGHAVDSHDEASIRQAFLNTPAAQKMAADLGLSKTALKDFSFAEQQELINEGQGSRARNFGDLKIAGTHYEQIEEDEDLSWL